MRISKELEAKILRCHFVEQWGANTIAVQLGIHHTTVDRVLCQAGMPKVERARRPSIVGRQWRDIDDLNEQALQWCESIACERPCPEDPDITVRQACEQAHPTLTMLPDNPYPTHERVEASVGKTPYVRFDLVCGEQ